MFDHGTTATFHRLLDAGWDAGRAGYVAAAVHHPTLFGPDTRVQVPAAAAGRVVRLACATGDPDRPDTDLVLSILFGDGADDVAADADERAAVYAQVARATRIAVDLPAARIRDEGLCRALQRTADMVIAGAGRSAEGVACYVAALVLTCDDRGPSGVYELYQHAFEAAFAGRSGDGGDLPSLLVAASVLEMLWQWALSDEPEGLVAPVDALRGPTSPVGAVAGEMRAAARGVACDDGAVAEAVVDDLLCGYLLHLGGDDPWAADVADVVARTLTQRWMSFADAAEDSEAPIQAGPAADWLPFLDAVWGRLAAGWVDAATADIAEVVSAFAYRRAGRGDRAELTLAQRC